MDYCKKYIGKDLREVTIEDIQAYFTKTKEESDTIEYKSYYNKRIDDHKRKESAILKTICAMLNSEGGLIIWGAPIEQRNEGTGKKEYSGQLSLIDSIIDKDTFIAKVSGRIIPILPAIRVEGLESADECLCVFEIDKSTSKPHRFSDRY